MTCRACGGPMSETRAWFGLPCSGRCYATAHPWPAGERGPAGRKHTRGEYVLGLGWSCIDCDTFYCPTANANSGLS